MVQTAQVVILAGLGAPRWTVYAAVILMWAIWLYFHPFKPCWACKGTGVNRGSSRKAFGRCRRCKGSRQVQRIGSRQLHRAVRATVHANRNRKDQS
jgi:hypothetical protein